MGKDKDDDNKQAQKAANPLSVLTMLPALGGAVMRMFARPEHRNLKEMQAGRGVGTAALAGLGSRLSRDQLAAQATGHGATRGLGAVGASERANDMMAQLAPAQAMTAAREQALATHQLRQNRFAQLGAIQQGASALSGTLAALMAMQTAAKDQGEGDSKEEGEEGALSGSTARQGQSRRAGFDPNTGLSTGPGLFPTSPTASKAYAERRIGEAEANRRPAESEYPLSQPTLQLPDSPPTALESVLTGLTAPMLLDDVPNVDLGAPLQDGLAARAASALDAKDAEEAMLREYAPMSTDPGAEPAQRPGAERKPKEPEEREPLGTEDAEAKQSVPAFETETMQALDDYDRATDEVIRARARKAIAISPGTNVDAPQGSGMANVTGERLQGVIEVLQLMRAGQGEYGLPDAIRQLEQMQIANPYEVLGFDPRTQEWSEESELWRP